MWKRRFFFSKPRIPDRGSPGCICVLSALTAHMHACMCLSACPSQPCVCWHSTCITLSLLIKVLLPGNLVAWQHECGSPRGDFNLAQRERKQRGKRKGRVISSTSGFPPFAPRRRGLHNTCLYSFNIKKLLSEPGVW